MLEGIDLFRLTGSRMQYLAERQNVISRNIANADTPGYAARDLTAFNFDSALTRQAGIATGPLAMARTAGSHITPASSGPGNARAVAQKGYGETLDGNQVSLEEQMVKAADNMSAFALASSAYAKSIAIMKLSIGNGR